MQTYETAGRVRLRLRMPAGAIEVRTTDEPRTTVEVEVLRGDRSAVDEVRQGAQPSADGGITVTVEAPERRSFLGREPAYRFRVTAPDGADLDASTASGSIRAEGRLGEVRADSASGSITIDRAERAASVSTVSGTIRIDQVDGDANVRTVSGSVRVDRVGGEANAHSISGTVALGEVGGSADVETVSGELGVESLGPGRTRLRSVSGRIRVAVRRGMRVWMDLSSMSGRTTSDLNPDGAEAPPGDHQAVGESSGTVTQELELRASTISGDIHVAPAAAPASGRSPVRTA